MLLEVKTVVVVTPSIPPEHGAFCSLHRIDWKCAAMFVRAHTACPFEFMLQRNRQKPSIQGERYEYRFDTSDYLGALPRRRDSRLAPQPELGLRSERRCWPDRADPGDSAPHGQDMNKDQVKGEAKDIAGKIQEQAGKLVGSKDPQVKGLTKQISGKVQKSVGDAKETLKELSKDQPK